MEMRRAINATHEMLRAGIFLLLLFMSCPLHAQKPLMKYTVSKGNMMIVIGKNPEEKLLDEFIKQFDLGELALKRVLKDNFTDSLKSHGWKLEANNPEVLVLLKPLFSAEHLNDPADLVRLAAGSVSEGEFPQNQNAFGYNHFRNGNDFTIKDSLVNFVLRNNRSAQSVLLAADFTGWQRAALPMKNTDTGWTLQVKLKPGKYTYKFIVDGNFLTDPGNTVTENDAQGNTNSVYYVTNRLFSLNGFTNAKKVFVAGSFNNWEERKLWMNKTAVGWELPVFLDTGTYTYRFVVDGKWMIDSANPRRFPNEFNEYNSVMEMGHPTLFTLTGLPGAKKVFLTGSFNKWRDFELAMTKTPVGWEIPYVLGAGNYEYKFLVDGQYLDAEGNELSHDAPGSVFVIQPNYTFHLKQADHIKTVFLAGDFNGWSANAYPMKKLGDEWVMQVHLSTGKHLYKFIADGEWIKDPANDLWEKNEFGGANSILWVK